MPSEGSTTGSQFLKVCTTCNVSLAATIQYCPHCGQVPADDPTVLVGQVLDGTYRIESLLGTGGMGSVYKARHIRLDDLVAVKTLKREMSTNSSWLKRFQREGQAARKFRHPNCVTVHDLRATEDGLAYLVLEFIDGHDLRAELHKRGRLTAEEIVAFLEPIASVLDAAHASGVVHRDLKPENVMVAVDARGQRLIKVLDLGIAKLKSTESEKAQTNLTIAGQLMGTPHYMPPEQWGELPRDGNSEIDGRADVYSLGVMAYEMATGTWPFKASTLPEWRRAHVRGDAAPVHLVVRTLPESFGKAVERAMAKDRADRFRSAGEFVSALRSSLASTSPVNGPDTQPQSVDSVSEFTTHAPATQRQSTHDVRTDTVQYPKTDPNTPHSGGTVVENYSTNPDAKVVSGGTVVETNRTGTRLETNPVLLPTPPEKRRSILPMLAVGVLLVGALAAGAAYVWRTKPATTAPPVENTAKDPSTPASHDTLHYFIEATTATGVSRLTGQEPLAGVTQYRLHFVPIESGYFYLLGPDQRNVPTLYYATPADRPAVAGKEIVFPDDGWIVPTGDTPRDQSTIVFSAKPLEDPAFLKAKPTYALSPADQQALEAFRASLGPASDAVAADGAAGDKSMLVRTTRVGDPVVFDLVISYAPAP